MRRTWWTGLIDSLLFFGILAFAGVAFYGLTELFCMANYYIELGARFLFIR